MTAELAEALLRLAIFIAIVTAHQVEAAPELLPIARALRRRR